MLYIKYIIYIKYIYTSIANKLLVIIIRNIYLFIYIHTYININPYKYIYYKYNIIVPAAA